MRYRLLSLLLVMTALAATFALFAWSDRLEPLSRAPVAVRVVMTLFIALPMLLYVGSWVAVLSNAVSRASTPETPPRPDAPSHAPHE